jgi:hypothetical protein
MEEDREERDQFQLIQDQVISNQQKDQVDTNKPKEKELDDDIKALLKSIVDHFDDEDRGVRDRQIRQWRRLKLLWENIQNAYYSEVAHDWRVPESERSGEESDQGYYDKPVNVFRAYLESIIAALSVTVPSVTCYPDDADNPIDITTAKAGDKIAELIYRHNNTPLLWLHALFIFCTEGMTACYNYTHEDKKYGTYEEKQYEDQTQQQQASICPNCGAEMSDPTITTQQQNKFQPGPEDVPADNVLQEADLCPSCAQMVVPDLQNQTVTVTRMVGVTNHPKARVCMEVYGGLFVKVPVWARNQADCSYLIWSYETHYANVLEQYSELRDKISKGSSNYDLYEQWGRTSPQYRGEHPVNNVTVRNCWLRPAAFNVLNKDESEKVLKLYPDGVKVTVVNDQVAYAENESLDDHWTVTYNPLSDYIHFDPLGLLLTSVQDITNDLISLVLQTVEHGIPQTFADPTVLNFNAYRNSEVIPGGIYPAKPKSGRALSEGFYEVKTATLSQEVLPFADKIQQVGQLVSGALPSLFGGQMAGSRTASEYSMSRAQALQRLQTTWKMLLSWWKEIFGKVIPMYIDCIKEDEKQVKKDEFGNFVNVFIRKAELGGKIGSIELEANENLPITWNQQKDAIMELFQLNNPDIMQALASPENIPYLKKAIGLTDYIIPGEDDRQKQYEEIELLINSEPIQMPPDPNMMMQAQQMGMPPPPPQMLPSIEVDPDVDNHALEADICRRWLVSDAGRLAKLENPPGYQNVLLHMKMHRDVMQNQMMGQQMMQQQPPQQQQAGQGSPPAPPAASTGQQLGADQNAPTIQ